MPTEVRANDKHNTLLTRVDEEGIYLYNKNTKKEEKFSFEELKEIIAENKPVR